jgi:glycosyltransferase involved in cell wall biosynthesis
VHPEIEAILCVSPINLNIGGLLAPISNVEFIGCPPSGLIRHSIDPELKTNLEKFSPDVIFIPVERYFHFNKIPVVNMVQNMEPLAGVNEKNPISEWVKNWFRAYYANRAIKKSDRVIAISEFVKEYLVKQLDILENKIGLVYHGIESSKNSAVIRSPIIPTDWEGKFIFTAGSIRPARGLEDVLWAMYYLSSAGEKFIRLVIAGDTGSNMVAYKNKLKRWVEKHGLVDRVCWAGNVGEDEMRWCYNNCSLFIMSSRVESFGQIALEAMSQGCICISADNPCLPEIFKNAAVYYPPKDSQSLAKVIKSVFSWDSSQRERMSELARNRAAEFSWDICAERTVAELTRVIKNFKLDGGFCQ